MTLRRTFTHALFALAAFATPARAAELIWLSPLPSGSPVAAGAVFELGLARLESGAALPLDPPAVRATGGEAMVLPSPDPLIARVLVRAGAKGVLHLDAEAGGAHARLALPIDDAVLGRLHVEVDVPSIVKRGGGPQRARVTVRGPAGPLPRVATTTGSLSELVADGDGVWRAELTPGSAPWPEVAIVTAWRAWPDATSPAASFAYATIGLASSIVLPGETRPNVDISVQIGARTFGPVRSDDTGHFEIPVVVPPGVRFGAGVSIDKLGNRRTTSIDLHVPPLERLALVSFADASLVGGFGVGLGIVTLDRAGQPTKELPTLTAKAGRVSDTRVAGDGFALGRYRPSGSPGIDTIVARLADGTEARVDVEARAGAPASISARAVPAVVTAPSNEKARIEVALHDRAGAPVVDAEVRARASDGAVSSSRSPREPPRVVYAPPSVRRGWEDVVSVEARATGGRGATRVAWDGAAVVVLDAADRRVARAVVRLRGHSLRADDQGALPLAADVLVKDGVAIAGSALTHRLVVLRDARGALHVAPRTEPVLVARVPIALADPVPVDVQAAWSGARVRWRVLGAPRDRAVRITASDGAMVTQQGVDGESDAPGPAPLFVQDVESGVAAVLFAP